MQIETAISSSRKELHSQGLRAPPCRLVEWTQLKDAFHHAASTTRACLGLNFSEFAMTRRA